MINLIQKVSAEIKGVDDISKEGGLIGLLKKFGGTDADLNSVLGAAQAGIRLALALAGIFALIMFLYGGVFEYIMSYGNDEKIKKASQTMLWSFVGLVIIAVSYTIIGRISAVFK